MDYSVHLHLTEHTYWLALDAGCKCGLAKCVRFGWRVSALGLLKPLINIWS